MRRACGVAVFLVALAGRAAAQEKPSAPLEAVRVAGEALAARVEKLPADDFAADGPRRAFFGLLNHTSGHLDAADVRKALQEKLGAKLLLVAKDEKPEVAPLCGIAIRVADVKLGGATEVAWAFCSLEVVNPKRGQIDAAFYGDAVAAGGKLVAPGSPEAAAGDDSLKQAFGISPATVRAIQQTVTALVDSKVSEDFAIALPKTSVEVVELHAPPAPLEYAVEAAALASGELRIAVDGIAGLRAALACGGSSKSHSAGELRVIYTVASRMVAVKLEKESKPLVDEKRELH
jgi:hypothetical protein